MKKGGKRERHKQTTKLTEKLREERQTDIKYR